MSIRTTVYVLIGLVAVCTIAYVQIAKSDTSQDAPLTDCDKYAANSLDPRAKGIGTAFEIIDPKLAIPACTDALRRYPKTSRFIFQLGRAYLSNKEYTKAFGLFGEAANQGDAFAQNALGVMYTNGLGVEKNYVQALAWYRKAADQGNEFSKKQVEMCRPDGALVGER